MSGRVMGIAGGAAFLIVVAAVIPIAILTTTSKASTLPPTAVTPVGRFEGKVMPTYDGDSVIRYAGIPFAEPPIGDLRFRPPQPLRAQTPDQRIDAQNPKKSCWSITKKSTSKYYGEDCLYLNIYVPDRGIRHDDVNNRSFPVAIWIHGGGFVAGSAFPEPLKFVTRGEVIVVNVNYRLGVFGFLTTEDAILPANNGLWDQVMAMKWVKENIEYFGGDPNAITIFGESAGAMSAAIHAVSPVSSNLFNRVLMQSGAAQSLLRKNPAKMATHFGEKAGCVESDDTTLFASCLRNLSIDAILKYSKEVDIIPGAGKYVDFYWIPNVDKVLLPDEPGRLLNNETYLASINAFDKDYLFGLNNNDGSLPFYNFLNPLPVDAVIDTNFFSELVDHLLTIYYEIPEMYLKNVSNMVTSFYTRPLTSADHVRAETVMDLASDAIFAGPGINMATAMSVCYDDLASQICESNISQVVDKPECREGVSGRSYVYVFDYCGPRDGCTLPCMIHGAQVPYQFPKRAFENDVDRELSDKFIDFLSDFIRTGNPGPNMTSDWPPYERNLQSYFSFSPFPIVKQYLHPYRLNLWLSDIPKLLGNTEEEEL